VAGREAVQRGGRGRAVPAAVGSLAPALPSPGSFPGLCPAGLSGLPAVPGAGAEQLRAPAASCAAPSPALGPGESRAGWTSRPALLHHVFLGPAPSSSSSLCVQAGRVLGFSSKKL